jgi:hypothetical protein
MSEEDLELLITTDDPGEDSLEEDTFHLQPDGAVAARFQKGGAPSSKEKVIENDPRS